MGRAVPPTGARDLSGTTVEAAFVSQGQVLHAQPDGTAFLEDVDFHETDPEDWDWFWDGRGAQRHTLRELDWQPTSEVH